MIHYSSRRRTSPTHPQPTLVVHRRRAFLLVEALAGAALVIFALSLTLIVLKKDLDLRRLSDDRLMLLQTSENVLERCSSLPFESISQERVDQIATQVVKSSIPEPFQINVRFDLISGTPSYKRLHVVAKNQHGVPQIQLWRDFYEESKSK